MDKSMRILDKAFREKILAVLDHSEAKERHDYTNIVLASQGLFAT
jgi:hypothetical protein